MTTARVAVLTPPGTGAIATVAVVGPGAWAAVRVRFRPAGGKTLPDAPTPSQFWFGTFGDGMADEVVVAVTEVELEPRVEVHGHGGRRVVRWLVEQFRALGCDEVGWQRLTEPGDGRPRAFDTRALVPLTQAPTLRTASILLDQYHRAFADAAATAVDALDRGDVAAATTVVGELVRHADVGRHLVAAWRVTVAGPPNAGKSALVNALAGFERSIVAPVAGTTRDVVTVAVALDGWPVELADTAGLRDATEPVEAEGIGLARRSLGGADLILWAVDGSDPTAVEPPNDLGDRLLTVVTKSELPSARDRDGVHVSSVTGDGIAELTAAIVARLVRGAPPPGAGVPFTPALADAIGAAHNALTAGETGRARDLLAACVAYAG